MSEPENADVLPGHQVRLTDGDLVLRPMHEADHDLVAGIGPAHPDFSGRLAGVRLPDGQLVRAGPPRPPPCVEHQPVASIAVWQVVVSSLSTFMTAGTATGSNDGSG